MTDDGPHVHETPFTAILDEMAAINGTVLAHSMGIIACHWHMLQQMKCHGINSADGFVLEHLEKAIREGERLGRRYLEIWKYDRESPQPVKQPWSV